MHLKSNYYKDKTVWITGASSGIGKGLALALSEKGAFLILSARREDRLKDVQSSLAHPTKSVVSVFDIEISSAVDSAAETILNKYDVDILILNAGISQRSTVIESTFETEARIMNTNFHGLVRLAKHSLKSMLNRGKGHFVVMSSVAGKIGIPGRSSYAASKHALHGYFDSLRAEVEDQGINVTVICPGYIYTNISYNAIKGNGVSQGKIDKKSKEGMSVELFSGKVLKGISNRKRELLIGGKETLGVYLKRFFPSILFKMVKNVKE